VGNAQESVRIVGRYALYGAIASGGMATVHFGRLLGPVGFSRTVAIKRLHAQYAQDPEFVSMFLDEARLAARIRHPNVVPTLDVVATGGELFLVMDYVQGESLARLTRGRERANLRIISSIITGALHGLHAAHEAKDERGMPLGIVHRDVSPQNVLVGIDGVSKILDFGVAKAAGRSQTTRDGQIKGKLAYMPPEQLRGASLSRTTDIYATGVVLWEMLTGQRLFQGDNEGAIVTRILEGKVVAPSRVIATQGVTLTDSQMRTLEEIDRIVLRALASKPETRYATAREMALELEHACHPATASVVGEWVERMARDVLSTRAARIAEIESRSGDFDIDSVMRELAAPSSAKPSGGHAQAPPPPPSHPQPSQPYPQPSHPNLRSTLPMSASPMSAQQKVLAESTNPMPVPRSPMVIEATPLVTQPSSISVATGRRSELPPGGDSRLKVGVAVAVVALLSLSMIASAIVIRRNRQASAAAENAAADVTITTTTATTTAPTTSPTTSGTSIDVPVQPASASAVAADTTAPPVTSAATAATTPTAATAATAAATAKPTSKPTVTSTPPKPPTSAPPQESCNPPFYFDAQGVKRYKPQCL